MKNKEKIKKEEKLKSNKKDEIITENILNLNN